MIDDVSPGRAVEVTWGDAWHDETGYPMEELRRRHKPAVVRSVGYVIKSDEEGITLAGCIEDDETCVRSMFIPRGMVRKVKVLRGS